MHERDFALRIANLKVCRLNADDAADKWEKECHEPSYCTHTDLTALAEAPDGRGIEPRRRRVFP